MPGDVARALLATRGVGKCRECPQDCSHSQAHSTLGAELLNHSTKFVHTTYNVLHTVLQRFNFPNQVRTLDL